MTFCYSYRLAPCLVIIRGVSSGSRWEQIQKLISRHYTERGERERERERERGNFAAECDCGTRGKRWPLKFKKVHRSRVRKISWIKAKIYV